jgi:FkbM family methyltransferase
MAEQTGAPAAMPPVTVTFAQNFEDVYLSRAFRDERGFYIDVGAAHPKVSSVTALFYARGWNGINIEPQPHYHAALSAARPRDITLDVAVSNRRGRSRFFLVRDAAGQPGSGGWNDLSTADPGVAERCRRQGLSVTDVDVETRTLADICEEYCTGRRIDILKIDVEGSERRVLEGADLARWRPRTVVVEATTPNTRVPSYHQWEDLLRAADYRLAWSDGLNRYYVAPEAAHLADALAGPVSVFDGVVIPAWFIRLLAQAGRVLAPTAARQPGHRAAELADLLARVEDDEAALPVLLAGRYRQLLPLFVAAFTGQASAAFAGPAATITEARRR